MKYSTEKYLFLAIALLLVGAGWTVAQSKSPLPEGKAPYTKSVDPAMFTALAASSNEFEIRSSEMAKRKSAMPQVKAFADRMLKDHNAAKDKLSQVKGGVTPPQAPLVPKHAAMLEQLGAASEAEFDALYLDMQLVAHNDAVALFETFAASPGEGDALTKHASEMLPTLRAHRAHLKRLISSN